MLSKAKNLLICIVLVVSSLAVPSVFAQADVVAERLPPTLIVISIDGARYDYPELYQTGTLLRLAGNGLRAEHLQPAFPTKTFSNHYSLVTGLHPENHGIVDNTIYDAASERVFSMGNRAEVQDPFWWGGEPIWVTAEKQGMVAGTFFFPGSEAPIKGIQARYWFQYDHELDNRHRVETVLSWLELPKAERPQLITLYFSDADSAGHDFGPDSPEVAAAMAHIDQEINYLVEGLDARDMLGQVDIMITSDHGMASVDLRNHIIIDEAFDTGLARRVNYSRELISIFPQEGEQSAIIQQLEQSLPSQATIYTRDTMPARFHFTNNKRIAPIVVLADRGWVFLRRSWLEEMSVQDDFLRTRGGHGYDNAEIDMQGLLIAHGPSFAAGKRIGRVQMVDLYNVMTEILGLDAAPNDGDPAMVQQLLAR